MLQGYHRNKSMKFCVLSVGLKLYFELNLFSFSFQILLGPCHTITTMVECQCTLEGLGSVPHTAVELTGSAILSKDMLLKPIDFNGCRKVLHCLGLHCGWPVTLFHPNLPHRVVLSTKKEVIHEPL